MADPCDRWTSATNGALSGSAMGSLGAYQLCLDSGARYCLVGIENADASLMYTGVCITAPNCTHKQVEALVRGMLNLTSAANQTAASSRVYCSNFVMEWTPMQIFALVVVALGLAAVLAASVVDYCGHSGKEKQLGAAVQRYSSTNGDDDATDEDPSSDRCIARTASRFNVSQSPLIPSPAAELTSFNTLLLRLIKGLSLKRNFLAWRFWDRGNTMNVFSALRVLCWVWIVVAETVSSTRQVPGYAESFNVHNVLYALVADTGLPVATILFISGYTAQDQLVESRYFAPRTTTGNVLPSIKIAQHYLSIIVARWARIVPLYLAVIILLHPVTSRLGSGPYWEAYATRADVGANCQRFWWTNALFVNNIYPTRADDRCYPWAYYFALDLQYFACSPLLTFTYFFATRRFTYVIVSLVFSLSLLAVGLQDSNRPLSDDTQPQLMIIPFACGSLLCLLCRAVEEKAVTECRFTDATVRAALTENTALHQVQDVSDASPLVCAVWQGLRTKRNRIIAIWLSFFLQIGIIIGEWGVREFAVGNTALATVFRLLRLPLWSLGLVASMVPLIFGYGGWVRRFLSHRLWAGASRLVFAAYLVSPLISTYFNATSPSPARTEVVQLVYRIWGNIWLSLGTAFTLHMVIERPMIAIFRPTT